MLPSCVVPMLRRASFAVLPTLLVFGMSIAPSAMAQSIQGNSDSDTPVAVDTPSTSTFDNFSSSADALSVAKDDLVAPSAAGQYSDRYGRRHSDRWSRIAIEAGGGANAPTSDSSSYITWGGNFTVGGGYALNPHISMLAEYQFIDDKLPGRIISEAGADGGHAHIWSLTLSPVVYLFPKRKNDVYVTGGGGFYRKVTSFTDPTYAEYCDYYYCGITTVNQVVGHFSSNQSGWNIGAGFTRKLSDGRTRIFAEARYLSIDTPAVTTEPNGLGTTTVAAGTKLVPMTFGVRF